ncbi:MAG: hypothetical protein IIW56_04855 [Oscillospiraceae bacterium]|nr:hypothetical protein [Oscillospiraceae bacterium]
METILTFDVGTTAIKTCLFDKALNCLAIRTDEYTLSTELGTVELDCEVYWNTICLAVSQIKKEVPEAVVQAICLTTQGETMIPVTEDGTPLHRAVVWLDDRAKDQAERISKILPTKEMYGLTGVTDMNGFVPLPKLLWFKEERPEIYEKAYKFLLVEDFVLHRLTGEFVTEKSLLTSTAYYDIRNDRYWTELLERLDLDVNKLPTILDCGAMAGTLRPQAQKELGLGADVKVFAGAMDQIAAAIGGGGMQDGVVTATVGTAMVLTSAITSMDECTDESLIVYRGIRDNQYAILPLCSTAGAVFKWFKDQCSALTVEKAKESGKDPYDLLCEEAAGVAPGADGVIHLPYFCGSLQPTLLPDAKGVFFGLGLTTNHASMTRAVLESIGYMLRENLEMLKAFGINPTRVHFFGGGAKNPIWNQIIADITGVELVLLEQSECGSLGAAMMGAVSMGWYDTMADAQAQNLVKTIVKPNHDLKEIYDEVYDRYQKLFRALIPLFENRKGE